MPTRQLPKKANIKHLKTQARDLLKSFRAHDAVSMQQVREFHPRLAEAPVDAPFLLSDAQLTIARSYGFRSWPRLVEAVAENFGEKLELPHHERISDIEFRRAVDMLDEGDLDSLKRQLATHPDLATRRVQFEGGNYFSRPALLEFVAENPFRNESLPPNIVEIAAAIIAAGADQDAIASTLGLVATGRIVRETGHQPALIKLLCKHGANPDAVMLGCLAHGEFEASDALIDAGATVDLVVAAATGQRHSAEEQIDSASALDRHRALALAAQHGHADIVTLMLDAGEDPNRYNPDDCHAHATPLHQAALGGHIEVVRTLVNAGADPMIPDTLHRAPAAAWAEHGPHPDIAQLLVKQSSG